MIDDDAYVRELLAILTNPDPTCSDPSDPYRLADDLIDRYDGFGSDFWVESLRRVSDGPWDELEVTFGLDIAALSDSARFSEVPGRSTFRVTFDREWRELSRYDEPAAYAPRIASGVDRAVRDLVGRHRSPRPEAIETLATPTDSASIEVLWDGLLAELGSRGSAREIAPGCIEMTMNDDPGEPPQVLTVLVTRAQWAEFVRQGSHDYLYFDELIGPREDDEVFVVFTGGCFVRSIREKLPPVHGGVAIERRLAEIRAEHPEAKGGWFAFEPPAG